tara:strand:+ start:90 stop:1496 length:1407 start_codon:yes stop_codon:yes gene_type:complete
MTLQSSGQIKFSEIADEFGNPTSNRLGNYRVSENIGSLTNLPLDTGVPQSGQIKFSDFYNKEANIIVDCHSFGSSNYNVDAYTDRFATGNFDVVGGYRTSVPKNQWQGGKTVIINVNKTFSSSGASLQSHFALATGNFNNENSSAGWKNGTELSVVVGPQGSIVGKGGNGGSGGYGGNAVLNGGNGGEGTSALKKPASNCPVTGESRIRGGGGGGGGGTGVTGIPESDDEDPIRAFGGGGGGGQGIPAGTGGTTTNNTDNRNDNRDGHSFSHHAYAGTTGTEVVKTFSSSNVVGGNDRYIQINGHGFQRAERVRYNNTSGNAIGGLSNNTVYFVIPYRSFNFQQGWYDDPNRIRLATSDMNARQDFNQGLITTSGSGNHSLTALGGSGGPGARIVTAVDESADVDAYVLMGEGGNGGTSPSGGGNGSSGAGGSSHYGYQHGGGTSWVEESSEANQGSGGNGGFRYLSY